LEEIEVNMKMRDKAVIRRVVIDIVLAAESTVNLQA
jgi:hypothetical protein